MSSNRIHPSASAAKQHESGFLSRHASALALGAAAIGCAAMAVHNHRAARRAEADNPPIGQFVTAKGVKLHYLDRGEGPPVLLIHGNGTTVEDWLLAGVIDELSISHRVLAFDRPGFGHSERPRGTLWGPMAQAALLAEALRMLGIDDATVLAHSFGTQVAIALALDHPARVARLVLLGGYYYPSLRADAALLSPPAIPLIGDLLRHVAAPQIAAAMLPGIVERLFAPADVPEIWSKQFPEALMLRPSQLRAAAAESAMMIPAAAALSRRYAELDLPVTIIAGDGDRIVDPVGQSERLHQALPQSTFTLVAGGGHMLHHSARDVVLAAVASEQDAPTAAIRARLSALSPDMASLH